MTQPLSVINFCYFWVAVLSFFFTIASFSCLYTFRIKSTVKIVVVMKKVTSFLLRGSIMDATPLNTKLKALRTTLGRLFSSKNCKTHVRTIKSWNHFLHLWRRTLRKTSTEQKWNQNEPSALISRLTRPGWVMTTKEITINKNRYRLLNKFPSSTKGKYMENSVENMHIDITVFQRSMTMHTSSSTSLCSWKVTCYLHGGRPAFWFIWVDFNNNRIVITSCNVLRTKVDISVQIQTKQYD